MPSGPSGPMLWGVATSSYQIEGYPLEDGGGPCIWHEFAHTPGTVEGGDTGDVACDSYHRWQEDVELLAQLGVGAYRFSLRWPRILPDGVGTVNARGLDHYDRLVDALLERGIRPFPTLYHWDLPAALENLGGWRHPDMPRWFGAYAETVARRLGDRLDHVLTLNEPWVTAFQGHVLGRHAPGLRSLTAGLRVVHHQILAHQQAAQAIRAQCGAQVGIALSNTWVRPHGERHRDAARRAHAWLNFPLFLDPLLRGRYPPETASIWPTLPEVPATPAAVDFVGINYYASTYVAADEALPWGFSTVEVPGRPTTDMGWVVDPSGLRWLLVDLYRRYGQVPVYVTENGCAYQDQVVEGQVHDLQRTAYLAAHIRQVLLAVQEGVDVRGYFVWSLLDNFEWHHGYGKRFGLVYVDPTTQNRLWKDSAHWYARLCRGETHMLDTAVLAPLSPPPEMAPISP